jgi:hypothetical protein
MPNRNTFDDREKYDHSGHRTSGREPGDLAAAPNPKEKAKREKPNVSSVRRKTALPFIESPQ